MKTVEQLRDRLREIDAAYAGRALPPARVTEWNKILTQLRRQELRMELELLGPEEDEMSTPPQDPYANKTIVSAVGTLVLVGLRWLISGQINLDDEGVVALAGAVTTALVYVVSNYKRLFR